MSEDGNYDAQISGRVRAINVGKRGVELIVEPDEKSGDSTARVACRLDRSIAHLDNMLRLAETALLNNLIVSLFGHGDDRDDSLEFDEIRISRDGRNA